MRVHNECGEYHNTSTPCRTPEQIMAECAPAAGYADQARAARTAARNRLSDQQASLGLTA